MDLRQAFEKAREENYALGAFNVSTSAQVKAILNAAVKKNAPIILELSPGEAEFFGIEVLAGIRDGVVKDPTSGEVPGEVARSRSNNKVARSDQECKLTTVPHGIRGSEPAIFLNLDHGKDFDSIKRALDAGFDMVHFDGSELPFEENIKETKKVVELAHKRGALVEGEIDQAGGHSVVKEETGRQVLTDPERASQFIRETGVDIFASFFGNLHGVYDRELELDFAHFTRVKESVLSVLPSALSADVFFSLHGGSGVRRGDLSKAAKQGIVKMNFNTELRQAWASSLRESLAQKKDEIVPYKVLPPVVNAVQEVVEGKIKMLICKDGDIQ